MKEQPKIRLGLLLTGNEVMAGDILDTNSSFIAKEFASIGLKVEIKVAVSDDLEYIANQLRILSQRLDILIVNGGLGNTIDDLTAQAAAIVAEQDLVPFDQAVAHVRQRMGVAPDYPLQKLGKQVYYPQGSQLLNNPTGTALGFSLILGNCCLFFTPGVPDEMRPMISQEVIPRVLERYQLTKPVALNRLYVLGIGEYRLEQWIKNHLPPETWKRIQLGFRAHSPWVEVKFGIEDAEELPFLEDVTQQVTNLFPDYIFSTSESLAASLNRCLREKGKTLTLAESCTGGLISSLIVAVPGASDVLGSAFVTYSYESKTTLLGVDAQELATKGAVSSPVVTQMVKGALERTGADFALAVSGIAGPGGGTPEKPIGTVYIGWGNAQEIHTRRLWVQQERSTFQYYVAHAALDLLRRFIQGLPTDHPYYFDALTRDQLPKF